METESVAPEKGGDEDVEMKNSETVEEHKDDVALSPFAGKLLPLTWIVPFLQAVITMLVYWTLD
jgi:hypothetical protein